jgi:hypothetical protein
MGSRPIIPGTDRKWNNTNLSSVSMLVILIGKIKELEVRNYAIKRDEYSLQPIRIP